MWLRRRLERGCIYRFSMEKFFWAFAKNETRVVEREKYCLLHVLNGEFLTGAW
jgi:hypothetical protein